MPTTARSAECCWDVQRTRWSRAASRQRREHQSAKVLAAPGQPTTHKELRPVARAVKIASTCPTRRPSGSDNMVDICEQNVRPSRLAIR